MTIEVTTPNGKKSPVALEAQLNVKVSKEHPKEDPLPVALPIFMPIPFERPGQYQVRCDINGKAHFVPLTIAHQASMERP